MRNNKRVLALTIASVMMVSMTSIHAEYIEENHGTGLQAMTEERRSKLMQHATVHTGNEIVPYSDVESIDNSDTIYFPEIKDQGSTGACVAYATTYYQLSYTVSKALNQDCDAYTFNPLWTYSLINSGEDEGSIEDDAYVILSDFGAPHYSDFTGSKTSVEKKASVWKSAMQYKIDPNHDGDNWDVHYFENTDEFIVSAKQQLASGKVLTTGSNSGWWYGDDGGESVTAKVTKDGKTNSEEGIAYIYDNGNDEGRHLITIVGYDDTVKFTYGNYSTTGGFKIANSWGTSWGNDGYIWVAYDAFYSDSDNRSSSRNGYGFVSSWWNEGTDENVYYTIDLDDNYSIYTPEYIGEVKLSSKSLYDMSLTYKGKMGISSALSDEIYIYDGSDYSGMPDKSYSGTIALDLSDLASYINNDTSYWEVFVDGISTANLKIVNSSDDEVYPETSGTMWVKSHTHVYVEGEKIYSNDGTWNRTDTCSICEGTTNVIGQCDHNYAEGEKVYSSDGTWSKTYTCTVCRHQTIEEGTCEHSYIEGEKTYSNTGTWRRVDSCSICGHKTTVTGTCEHDYVYNGITYSGDKWSEDDVCSICNKVKEITSGTCFFNLNFENSIGSWGDNGLCGISTVTDEITGNKYMKVEYIGTADSSPKYFEMYNPQNWLYASDQISGNIEMSFDVMFEGADADIYLRKRAEDINYIVLRISSKETGRLQYGSGSGRWSFYGADGDYVSSVGRWFNVKIVAHISDDADKATQSIYVTDKNTGELITQVENVALVNNVADYCNIIMIGGSSTVNIDNMIIRDVV